MAYAFITGAIDTAVAELDERSTNAQCIHWIGFRTDVARDALVDDAFGTFADIRMISSSDVSDMATDYARRTQTDGRISFGLRRTKLLKGLVYWVMDFYRVSDVPDITGLSEVTFKSQLQTALARADIRRSLKDNTKTAADAASPGPLESERKWKQWENKFTNYTRCHLGACGVPLAYVIRLNDAPDRVTVHADFIARSIACAPLSGEYYEADRRQVFDMIVAFTTGQPSFDWIKSTMRYNDGRRSMLALRAHFAGAGNATRSKAEADRLKNSLHYKSERSMTFEQFLTQCQHMYNIYEEENEPMHEDAKIRFLYSKVQHPDLQPAIQALKVQESMGTVVTYAAAANHISTAVTELPEYISKNRNVSGLNTKGSADGNGNGGSSDGIYNADGSIRTGHIPNWGHLSKAEKNLVFKERRRLGIKGGKKGNGSANNPSLQNQLKQLKSNVNKHKRTIKALRAKNKDLGDDDDTTTTANESQNNESLDAGDQFGGRNNAKKARNDKK